MSDRSPSAVVYDFLIETIGAVTDDEDLLYQAGVLDSKSQKMTADRGLVVSNASFDLSPTSDDTKFFDAVVIIGIWSKISGKEATQRQVARDEAFTMAKQVANAIFDDASLGDRVCDASIERVIDGSRSITSTEYAVVNLPVILNRTGESVSYNFGEPRP